MAEVCARPYSRSAGAQCLGGSDIPHGGSASPEGGTSSCGQHGEVYWVMSGG